MTASEQFTSAWAIRPGFTLPPDPLTSNEDCDLAIIGGGFLGLTAALHAARQGLSVCLLDAARVGDRASGLNGGQVIAGFKYQPEELVARYGDKRGEALIRFGGSLPDAVFGLIEREKLDVPYLSSGWLQAAHSEHAARDLEHKAQQWISRGVPAKVLSIPEVTRLTGAKGYVGGWLDPRGGVVQPLSYVRELARIAHEAGVRIAENTRATRLSRRESNWTVATATEHEVRAKYVIVATNAYADAVVPGLAQTLVPLHSFQIATEQLPDDVLRPILPEGQAVSDSRRIVVYYRKSPDGRVLLGGRGSMAEPTSPKAWAHLEHALRRLYPSLVNVAIEKRWYGRVAMTADHFPHVHEPEPGLLVAAGCQGRGVGLMTALGPCLVDHLTTKDPDAIPLPITPIRPIPFHAFRNIGVGALITWYRLIDSLER